MKKKLKWSSIPVDDLTLKQIVERYAKETSIPVETITKRAIVNLLLANYANGKLSWK